MITYLLYLAISIFIIWLIMLTFFFKIHVARIADLQKYIENTSNLLNHLIDKLNYKESHVLDINSKRSYKLEKKHILNKESSSN